MASGLILGAIGGAGEGLLRAGAQLGEHASRASLADQASAITKERDARLEEFATAREGRQETRADTRMEKQFGHAKEMQAGGFEHAENLQGKGFEHAETMQGKTQDFTRAENALGRELQTNLAKMHEAGASSRHGASMSVQLAQLRASQEGVTLVPQADGKILKMSKNGESRGYVNDPVTGEAITGPKGLSDAAKILMEGNSKVIASLESAAAKYETQPEEKASLVQRIAALNNENKRLAGMKVDAPAPSGRNGWDSTSGQVFSAGKVIGTAKSQEEARSLFARSKSGAIGQ